ncbi:hypothetical protein [Streptomyces mirabilis]|jgi:hypothetical protein|uniref:Uncharacterized protein n=1 Tax=Streptomyces mirabilis TaxID=68239 RepID=A0A1I2XJR9_9ACTN|nr:hypothetical protein [Streptomyces mirabilis]SFH13710.1 hypothetical protein SAMN02787118_14810 [Streptomyces mirabilis]
MNKLGTAVLNGAAIGAGATVPLTADFRLAATGVAHAFAIGIAGLTALVAAVAITRSII